MSERRGFWDRLPLLYPRPFRHRYGADMIQALRDELDEIETERTLMRRVGLRARLLGEVIFHAILERGAAARAVAFAGPTAARPDTRNREGKWATVFDRVFHELLYVLRVFRSDPGFFAVTVLTLAIGIGANTAIFSVVKGVLLDTLPYAEPERVVGIWQYTLATGGRNRMTPGNYLDVGRMTDIFDAAAAFGFASATLISDGGPELIKGGRVSADYFAVLGVQPVVGRSFRTDDDDVGGPAIVIVGEELWTRRFAADPQIVGRTINLDGAPFEVVGVLPRGVYPTYATVNGETPFTPDNHDFLVPLRFSDDLSTNRRSHVLGAVGRLAEGVSPEQANDALEALATSIAEEHPTVVGEGFRVESLQDEILGGARAALWVLMGTVAVVLLIAATNVAGIMLARADARRSEIALRSALGAGRWSLVRQSLVESLALAGCGAAAGIGLAYLSVDTIKRRVPFHIPRIDGVSVDLSALLFAVAVALAVGIALGVAPAVAATSAKSLARLRQGARGLTADRTRRRTQGVLVAAQACMAVMLVVGAGLLVRTFVQIRSVDPGFSASGVVAVPLSLPEARYPGAADALSFYQQLTDSLVASRDVAAVAFGYDHPLRKNWGDAFRIEGLPEPAPGDGMGASFRPVTPGYFEAVGVPLRRGRTFQRTDDAKHPPVVIVNEAFAAQYFPGDEALGRRIRIGTVERLLGEETELWMEIVGIVGNVRFNGPTAAFEPAMYVSIPQVPMTDVVLMVAPSRLGANVAGAVRAAVWALDAELPVDSARTLDAMLSDAIARERFNMILVGLFALIALGLAGLGIYGLISRLVQMQSQEIGIRVALGAQRGQILALVLSGALLPVATGGVLGLTGAAGLTRLLESLLYEVGTLDPATFLLTPLVLLATTLVASFLPARRATRVDPISVLRQE